MTLQGCLHAAHSPTERFMPVLFRQLISCLPPRNPRVCICTVYMVSNSDLQINGGQQWLVKNIEYQCVARTTNTIGIGPELKVRSDPVYALLPNTFPHNDP